MPGFSSVGLAHRRTIVLSRWKVKSLSPTCTDEVVPNMREGDGVGNSVDTDRAFASDVSVGFLSLGKAAAGKVLRGCDSSETLPARRLLAFSQI